MIILVPAALALTLIHAAPSAAVVRAPAAASVRFAIAHQRLPAPVARPRGAGLTSGHGGSSMARKVAYGAVGALGGFLLGGMIGAELTKGCACDDPGLTGALFGGAGGAAGGAIFGVVLASR